MPGYAGESRKWNPKLGKWIKTSKTQAFDYNSLNKKSLAFLMSFFRWYPDCFYDLIRSKNAKYGLELIQRVMLRIFARYRNVYVTGSRGTTKTYVIMLGKDHDGLFFPGENIRYCAPNQKQSATLASQAFKEVCENYPLIETWWDRRNDTNSMFRISTPLGSLFTMYAPRGDNSTQTVAEEMGQEGEQGFDMATYEKDIAPTRRKTRTVNKVIDRCCVQLKSHHIGNASSKTNRAYTVHRAGALKDMLFGDEYDGYVLDIPWEVALLCQIRDIAYYKAQKKSMTPEDWLREMCAIYTGTGVNPMIPDATLAKAQKLMVMEETHCGDPDAIYIISHDAANVDAPGNAACADVVIKLTRYKDEDRKDIYRKQCVYIEKYPPQDTFTAQARRVKELWQQYCLPEGSKTYIVVDANGIGDSVVQELIKPTLPGVPLCTIGHVSHKEIEQPFAREVIYPLKAGVRGSKDADSDIVQNAQAEFAHGNVELLTSREIDGLEQYKLAHRIKDNFADMSIVKPYKNTGLLIQQISNLQAVTNGLTFKEKRKSNYIQRDMWSALKYALWFAKKLELGMQKEMYSTQSDWQEMIDKYRKGEITKTIATKTYTGNERGRLLSLRRR